jgi:hypothetical protein
MKHSPGLPPWLGRCRGGVMGSGLGKRLSSLKTPSSRSSMAAYQPVNKHVVASRPDLLVDLGACHGEKGLPHGEFPEPNAAMRSLNTGGRAGGGACFPVEKTNVPPTHLQLDK